MKTKLQILGIALAGLIIASCSSSMYMSKTSVTPTDDIYYTPNKTTTTLVADETSQPSNTNNLNSQNASTSKFSKLEKKYANVENPDSISSDTLAAKVENENPYSKILSDSYQESYERRLRGMEDPHYGMENWTTRYSNDYWYAQAYDPDLYNVVVMGDQIWVEPWYISSMFAWPHSHFGFGFRYGWNTWNPLYSNDFYFYYVYNYPYLSYNSWNSWNSAYNWDCNPYTNNSYNYYGRRTGGSTINTTSMRPRDTYENQIIASRRGNGTTSGTVSTSNTNLRTRNTTQGVTTARTQNTNSNQEAIRRGYRNENMNTTRLRGDGVTRNTNISTEQTRNSNTYQRPRSTNNNDYIRTGTRNQNISNGSNVSGVNTRNTSRGTSTHTYNSTGRVGTSTSSGRSTYSSGSSSGRGSSVNSSSSPRSSSGNSSSSSSSSSSPRSSSVNSSSSSSTNNSSSGSVNPRKR